MSKAIYDSRDPGCKQPFGALATGQTASFWVHLPKTMSLDTIFLKLYQIDRWDRPVTVPMHFCEADYSSNSYSCSYAHPEPALLLYHFEFHTGQEILTIKRQGSVGAIGDGEPWQLTVYDEGMETPPHLGEGVMYQIFPDRFHASGRTKAGVPEDRKLRDDWGGMPDWRPNEQGEVTNSDYFQGDLAGITEKLDYLRELGVTVLYLNPIFEAHSNHRYNTADYKRVDPLLGHNEDFRRLCREAEERGISVILDGVFSHTGSDSVYFNREGRYGTGGAFQDRNSPYFPWYRFRDHPWDYECWWGFLTLPNVEETEPSYLDFVCGQDGVLSHWLGLGASGFRLDVADELPDLFLDRLYGRVKEEKPGACVIGEVWEDASNKVSYGVRRRYLLGRQMDSVMNYPFKDALLRYIRYGGADAFYNSIMQILENYPKPVIPALMNFLSTHDTPRAITMLAGEPMGDNGREWQEQHHQLSPTQYQHGRRLLILAMVLQFGLPGMPCVYYGDEAGLAGYKDPFNRTCFPWGEEDARLQSAVRALGGIRRDYPIFSQASFVPLTFDDAMVSFAREHPSGEKLLFAANRSSHPRRLVLPHEDVTQVLFACGDFEDSVLGPLSAVVLRKEG